MQNLCKNSSRVLLMAVVLLAAAGLPSCGKASGARRTPSLAPVAKVPPAPPEKSWVQKTTDATWNTVASPVRGMARAMTPQRKPAKVVEPLEPAGPPELIIVTRENRGVIIEEPAATQPVPTTQP